MAKGPISRKGFIGLSALMAGALGATKVPGLSAPWRAEPEPPMPQRGGGIEADVIVVNARVLTQDAGLPRAEAFAVKDGRFLVSDRMLTSGTSRPRERG